MFFLKLAWRNIFRNKRRTIIAGIAIGIGLACMIFMDALMEGMQTNLIDSITSTFLGEAQIHDSDYRELKKVELTVNKPQKVLEQLSNDKKNRRLQSSGCKLWYDKFTDKCSFYYPVWS